MKLDGIVFENLRQTKTCKVEGCSAECRKHPDGYYNHARCPEHLREPTRVLNALRREIVKRRGITLHMWEKVWAAEQRQAEFSIQRELTPDLTLSEVITFPKKYVPGAPPVTKTVTTTMTIRPGQAAFRRAVLLRDGGCVITGTSVGEFLYSKGKRKSLLHAAHIKPVIKCNDDEYWDLNNGLTMRADIHMAFDHALFTIGENGQILPSRHVPEEFYPPWILNNCMRHLTTGMLSYLAQHREWAFKQWNRWAFD